MKIEHVKSSNGGMYLTFTLKNTGTALANAIRGISMGQGPVLSIQAITIK